MPSTDDSVVKKVVPDISTGITKLFRKFKIVTTCVSAC